MTQPASRLENIIINNFDSFSNCLAYIEVGTLFILSKKINAQTNKIYKAKCKATAVHIRSLLTPQQPEKSVLEGKCLKQIELAKQTLTMICRWKVSHQKKHLCLRALFASLHLIKYDGRSRDRQLFNAIALADIPHFVLTRCWEIGMLWERRAYLYIPFEYRLLTKRSNAALIQAYKNVALVDYGPIAELIITQGSMPIWEKKANPVKCPISDMLRKFHPKLSVHPEHEPGERCDFVCTNVRVFTKAEKIDCYSKRLHEIDANLKRIDSGIEKDPSRENEGVRI